MAEGIAGPKGLHETSGVKGVVPRAYYGRARVILDSGQSVDEAVFLEGYRRWVWHRMGKAGFSQAGLAYLLYPHRRLWARYGSAPINQYDEWEVRPIRWTRDMDKGGMFASAAVFEDGVIWKGREDNDPFDAPWRRFMSETMRRRRATITYLNPTQKDIEWMGKHLDYWKDFRRTGGLLLGQPLNGLPAWSIHNTEGFLAYDKAWRDEANRTLPYKNATGILWRRFWDYSDHKHFISAPGTWRHTGRIRWPSLVGSWAAKKGWECHEGADTGRWEDVEEATDCAFYVIAETQATMPFDALIAAARGATVIAPDYGMYRRIFDQKWLYPVHSSGHDALAWGQADVREWLYSRLSREEAKWRKQRKLSQSPGTVV